MLNDWELSYNGLVIGGWTDYDLTQFDGFEGFDVRTNDQQLPSLWGVQAGGDFVTARTMTVGVQTFGELTAEAAAFEAAFVPSGQSTPTALLPLVFKLPDQSERIVMCRVRRRARARTSGRPKAMAEWLVQLDAPDPRVYGSTLTVGTLGSYVADSAALDLTAGTGADLAFDLTVGATTGLAFDFGGTSGAGTLALTNAGDVDTFPAFTFTTTATAATWYVINDTTGEQASFAYALTPGHAVKADMAGVGTGNTDPPITYDGAANYAIWQTPRVPVRLVPGLNFLRFFVTSGTATAATCSVAYRDAYL